MEKVLCIAKLFNQLFKKEYGIDMDELRMH